MSLRFPSEQLRTFATAHGYSLNERASEGSARGMSWPKPNRTCGDPALYGPLHITDTTREPFDTDSVQPGDCVGMGIYAGNAIRGYEIGTLASGRAATEAGRVDAERFVAARWELLPHGRYLFVARPLPALARTASYA